MSDKNFIVLRTFPDINRMLRGQIISNPQWANLGQLVRSGYVREITDELSSITEAKAVISETPAAIKETEPVLNETEPVIEEIAAVVLSHENAVGEPDVNSEKPVAPVMEPETDIAVEKLAEQKLAEQKLAPATKSKAKKSK